MKDVFYQQINAQLADADHQGLLKHERHIAGAQQPVIRLADGSELLNFCANNYLGLANHPSLIAAAKSGLDSQGFGMASARFICGTQVSHSQLERQLAEFLGMEDSILYSSCFDANTGLFETLLGEEDAVISDALNHASIIDGIRLCKATRYRYANNNMAELEACLRQAREEGARHILIATDGVFSMDGVIADLASICDLADRYQALVMVDDSHAVGLVGETGRGTHEFRGSWTGWILSPVLWGKRLAALPAAIQPDGKRWWRGYVSAPGHICFLMRWLHRLCRLPCRRYPC